MSTGVKTHRITDPNDDTRFVDVDPYLVEGVPRVLVNVDQTASGHPARNSVNVSSTTDVAAGQTGASYTNNIASSDVFYTVCDANRGDSGLDPANLDTNGANFINWGTDGNNSIDEEIVILTTIGQLS
jgi:hypothetical protein